MDNAPNKDVEIAPATGNPIAIRTRGNQITDLGGKMVSAAVRMKSIVDRTDGDHSKAVDKLRESAGQGHEELKLAGEMYKPTGPALTDYADVLEEVKPLLQDHYDNCVSLWQTYITKQGAYDDADNVPVVYPSGTSPSDDGSARETAEQEHADDVATAKQAAEDAYGDWRSEAVRWETDYQTWKDAFDDSADRITTATDGGIEDSFWDDLGGIFEVVLTILAVAGIVLAVLALVIGGPLIAALAAIVAIATLALTAYQFFVTGRADGWDLAFAVIGVIPFGSMGKLGKGWKGAGDFALDFLGEGGGFFTKGGRAAISANASLFTGGAGVIDNLFSGTRSSFAQFGPSGTSDVITRIFSGKNADDLMSDVGSIVPAVWGDGFAKGGGLIRDIWGLPGALSDFPSDVGNMFTDHYVDPIGYFTDHR